MQQLVLEAQADLGVLSKAVRRAIGERIRDLDATLRLLRQSLREYELRHNMLSDRFYQKYLSGDELPDTNEFQMWAGEYEMYQELTKERDLLAGVQVCPSKNTSGN